MSTQATPDYWSHEWVQAAQLRIRVRKACPDIPKPEEIYPPQYLEQLPPDGLTPGLLRCPHEDGPGEAHPPQIETVTLRDLTPRARILAEATHRHGGYGSVLWTTGERDADGELVTYERNTQPLRHHDPRTATQWLEEQVQRYGVDHYPVGPARTTVPQPSEAVLAEAAADRYIERRHVLDYLDSQRCPIGVQRWDELSKAKEVPAPDRYVGRRPQWHVDTLNEWGETWTLDDIAEELGSTSATPAKSAAAIMSRLGVRPIAHVSHPVSRRGQAIYLTREVRAKIAARLGQGYRSDLAPGPEGESK